MASSTNIAWSRDVDEVSGTHSQELLPGRPGAAGRRVDSGIVKDLPDRGGRDVMAEPHQLALNAAVSPGGIFGGDADHELADPGGCGRASGASAAGVIPLSCDEAAAPGEQGRRGHGEHLVPLVAGDQAGQRREPQPVSGLI